MVFTYFTHRTLRLLFFFLILPLSALAQYDLTLSIEQVKTADGKIYVAVYDSSEDFLELEKVYTTESAQAKAEQTIVVIESLPKGTYAVAVFQDENNNDELDTNLLGIPKEPIGFSLGKVKPFGPPDFEECAFKLTADRLLSITIK